jgi:hypothetical protein
MKQALPILIALILLQLAASVSVETKDSYSQGETLIAKVSGNFFEPVSKENVAFYRGHVRTSVVLGVEKVKDDFYVYAQLADKIPGNYSLVIEDARYFNGSRITVADIGKNFTISESTADFSVDRGAVAANDSFSLQIRNLRGDETKISIGENEGPVAAGGFFAALFGSKATGAGSSTLVLRAGETKKINFDVPEGASGESLLYLITLDSENTFYEIPVYAFSTGISNPNETDSLRFEPSSLEIEMATDSESEGTLHIVNFGDTDVEDISVMVSEELEPYVTLFDSSISSISGNFSKKVEFAIDSDSDDKTLRGSIAAVAGDDKFQISVPVTIRFIKDYVPAGSAGSGGASRTCSQLNGAICSENEECSGSFEYAKDGVCCLAECAKIKKSSTGKIIGWLMILALASLVAWFYLKRYRKVESVSDFMKVLGRS